MTGSDAGAIAYANPGTCPACGGGSTARIQFGEPAFTPALEADLSAGRVVLGGCVIDGDPPPDLVRCRDCGAESSGRRVVGYAEGRGLDRVRARVDPPTSSRHELVARLVLAGGAASGKPGRRSIATRRWLLESGLNALRDACVTATFLVLPAGFLKGSVPDGLAPSHGWATRQTDFDALRSAAEAKVMELVDADCLSRLLGVVDHLVVGVDLYTPGAPHEPHGELAVAYDVARGVAFAITGKSYPTGAQERDLIRNSDLDNHVVELAGRRVAVLVCHDLMAWGARSHGNRKGVRADVATKLLRAVGDVDVALHLPHTASTPSWTNPWRVFQSQHPELFGWGSAILHRTTGDAAIDGPPPGWLLRHTGATDGGSIAVIVETVR